MNFILNYKFHLFAVIISFLKTNYETEKSFFGHSCSGAHTTNRNNDDDNVRG